MQVECLGCNIEVPEHLIEMYVKQFDGLPGCGDREAVLQLRNNVYEVIDYIAEDPEALHEFEYRNDFINAIAVRCALSFHGILYDA